MEEALNYIHRNKAKGNILNMFIGYLLDSVGIFHPEARSFLMNSLEESQVNE